MSILIIYRLLNSIKLEEIKKYFEEIEDEYRKHIESNEAKYSLLRISRTLFECYFTCLSSIKIILGFLNHKSEKVRNFACLTLCILLDMASQSMCNILELSAIALQYEENPKRLKELSTELISIQKQISNYIQNGFIPEDKLIKIQSALSIVKAGLLKRSCPNYRSIDKFLESKLQGSINRLMDNFNIDIFEKAKEKS